MKSLLEVPAPSWYHLRGDKVGLKSLSHEKSEVVLSSSTVLVKINPTQNHWAIEYTLIHARDRVKRWLVVLTHEEMRRAFGLEGSAQFEEVIVEGKFIRRGPYLNIPGREDRSAHGFTVSIYISDAVRKAVEVLLD